MLIGRRQFLVAAAALATTPAAAALIPADRQIRFQVVRDGSVIGTHALSFAPVSDGVDITVAIDIVVRFGPIALFRYRLDGVEQWRQGQVTSVDMRTDNDGTAEFMRAERRADGLWIAGSRTARYLAPPDALPATHWNRDELTGPWINPQDGKMFHPTVAAKGQEIVPAGTAGSVPAERFDLSGEVQLQLWYSAALGWTALQFMGRDGSAVRYERA